MHPPLSTSAPPPHKIHPTPLHIKSPPKLDATTSSKARKDKEKGCFPISKSFNLDRKYGLYFASPVSSSSFSSGKRKPLPAAGAGGKSPSLKKKKKTTTRALTKVPSFKKPASKVGEDKNGRRSACSSTMNSKFLSYLVFDHGVAEAESASAKDEKNMKRS